MATVLIGIDGSDHSRAALRFGATLAGCLGLKPRPLWAWQYPADTVARIGRLDLVAAEAADRSYLAQLEELVRDELGAAAASIDVEVARGPAVHALLHHDDAAMLVVGSRGLGGFRGLLLGSVSQQLCEHATVPVTVVRTASDHLDAPPQRILVGHDGSAHAAAALTFAIDLAGRCDAKITVVHVTGTRVVSDDPDAERTITPRAYRETVEGWCRPAREADADHDIEIVDGDPRTALLHVATTRDADLLVVGTRGRGAFANLLLGSVAASVIRHSEIPVTVIPRSR